MTDAPVVRRAAPEDWPGVARLLADLGRPDPFAAGSEAALREVYALYLRRSDAAALVADGSGSIVGFCNVEFRVRLNFDRPQAWIPDLIVAEHARGTGAGAALLAEAERLARERGCWGMTLESASWRTGAHAFYRHMGWLDGGLSFSKPIADIPWPPQPRPGA